MKIHEATEQAYKNGYEKGYEDGKPKWIPVTERLPEKSGKYIVCSRKNEWDDPKVYQTKFYRHILTADCHWGQKDKGKNITHWMPLPEPPRGDCF